MQGAFLELPSSGAIAGPGLRPDRRQWSHGLSEVRDRSASNGWETDAFQLGPGDVNSECIARSIASLRVTHVTYDSAIAMQTLSPHQRTLILPSQAPQGYKVNGVPCGEAHLLDLPIRSEVDFIVSKNLGLYVIYVDQGASPELDLAPEPQRPLIRPLASGAAKRLSHILSQVLADKESPDTGQNEESYEAVPAWRMLLNMTAALERLPVELNSVEAPSVEIAKLARDCLLGNLRRSVTAAELSSEVAVPLRTLHHAFKGYFGISPVKCHRLMRLARAREQLKRSRAGSTTVTTVALDWGFCHFGRFAVAYKCVFGESPSTTLAGHG